MSFDLRSSRQIAIDNKIDSVLMLIYDMENRIDTLNIILSDQDSIFLYSRNNIMDMMYEKECLKEDVRLAERVINELYLQW